MNLRDGVVVVTGGASGLGEATVTEVIAKGGKAVILDLSVERGQALVEKLGADKALFVRTDITSEEEVRQALDQAVAQFGAIHAVVNCAGIAHGEKTVNKGVAHSLQAFTRVIQVNLVGAFNVIRLAAEKMATNPPNGDGERGVIINTASVAAFDGQIGQAAYSASKAGIVGMTLPIARDLARDGIRCVTIAPGLFETPMFASLPDSAREALAAITPFPQRLGRPSEYGQLAVSIMENPMLNGETIRLDGAVRLQPK